MPRKRVQPASEIRSGALGTLEDLGALIADLKRTVGALEQRVRVTAAALEQHRPVPELSYHHLRQGDAA